MMYKYLITNVPKVFYCNLNPLYVMISLSVPVTAHIRTQSKETALNIRVYE
jgi:hypothetical protein